MRLCSLRSESGGSNTNAVAARTRPWHKSRATGRMASQTCELDRVSWAGNAVRTIDDSESKLSRSKLGHPKTEKIRPYRTLSANSKLQELRLAFGTLAKKIQGVDQAKKGDERLGASSCSRTSGDHSVGVSEAYTETKDIISSSHFGRDLIHLQHQSEAIENSKGPQGVARKVGSSTSLRFLLRGKEVVATGQGIPYFQSRQEDRKCLVRMKAAAYAAGRDTAEVAARHARQELERVRSELVLEKRSREAADSALQEVLQQKAAGGLVEREKLTKSINSFGGRSLGDLAADCESFKQRARDSERSLAEAQLQIDTKANEALEALERATAFGLAMEKERVEKFAGMEERKKLTQDLRACLRSRAKAEEAAAAASRALQQSETQRQSLVQRLEVLRSVNKRLDKKVAAAVSATSSSNIAESATEAQNRLATARTCLRNLSASHLISNSPSSGGVAGDATKAALERAFQTTIIDKKWEGKLRDIEKRGEVYRAAAQAAETAMHNVIKEKVKLEEKNRILSKRICDLFHEDSSATARRGTPSVAAPVASVYTQTLQRSEDAFSSRFEINSANDRTKDTQSLPPETSAAAPTVDRSSEVTKARTTVPTLLITAAIPPMNSSDLHQARSNSGDSRSTFASRLEVIAQPTKVGEGFIVDRKTSPLCATPAARSNSLDPDERPAPSRGCRAVRPRSASETSLPNRRAHRSVHEQNDASFLNQLLTDSRQLRADVLSALRCWPSHEGVQLHHAVTEPEVLFRAPPPETDGEDASLVEIAAPPQFGSNSVASVPVDVLLRLCGRRAQFEKGGRESKSETSIGRVGMHSPTEGCSQAEVSRETVIAPALDAEDPTPVVEDHLLPPGVSAAIAQQVRGAVSRGDERGFLQIIGRCGSTARVGIARLLALDPPDSNREPAR